MFLIINITKSCLIGLGRTIWLKRSLSSAPCGGCETTLLWGGVLCA